MRRPLGPYNGPVAGLTSQFIYPTTDQVTVTVSEPIRALPPNVTNSIKYFLDNVKQICRIFCGDPNIF